MELVLTRIAKRKGYTIGRLYIVERVDDEYLAGEKQTYFLRHARTHGIGVKDESLKRSSASLADKGCIAKAIRHSRRALPDSDYLFAYV